MADASIISVLLRAKDEASKTFKNVEVNAGTMAQKVLKHHKAIGLAMTAVGGAITGVGIVSIKAASDVAEMQAKFNTVFGSLSGEVEDWAKTHAGATNRSRFDLMEYASTLQDTFVPMGFARDEASQFAREITELAIDLGSFNNQPTAEVVKSIQSALVGSTETVRKYGVVITAAGVEQEILNQGWATSKGEITEAMKVQARMNIIMAGTTDAQGDAIRTSDSFANQMVGLKSAVTEAQVSIGQALLPAITALVEKVTPIIIKFAEWTQENQTLFKVIALVTGAIGAALLVLGPMVLILPQLVAGMKLFAGGIRIVNQAVAANPIGALIKILTTLALVVLPIVIANWESIWNKIQQLSETAANFVIGILNKLTFVWRNQVALILDFVGKLLEVGSNLPFVGDKFKKASEMIDLVSDKLKEGIPTVDFYAEKQEELGKASTESSDAVGKSADVIQRSMAELGVVSQEAADKTEKAFVKMAEDAKRNADASMRIARIVRDTEQQLMRERADDYLNFLQERRAARLKEAADRQADLNDLESTLNFTQIAWEKTNSSMEDVVEAWSEVTGKSIQEVIAEMRKLDVDVTDVEATLKTFAEQTGHHFFVVQEDVSATILRLGDDFNEFETIARNAMLAVEDEVIGAGNNIGEALNTATATSMSGLERMILQHNARLTFEIERKALEAAGVMKIIQRMADEGRQIDPGFIHSELVKLGLRDPSDKPLVDPGDFAGIGSAAAQKMFQLGGKGGRFVSEEELRQLRGGLNGSSPGMGGIAKPAVVPPGLSWNAELGVHNPAFLASLERMKAEGNPMGSRTATGHVVTGAGIYPDYATQGRSHPNHPLHGIPAPFSSMAEYEASLPRMANGGIVRRPTLAMIGEKGPEAVVPLGRGVGQTNNFHFHGAVYGLEDLKEVVIGAVRDHAVRGGFSGVFAEA